MKKILFILFLTTSFFSFSEEKIIVSNVLKDLENPKIDFIKKYSNNILDKDKAIFLEQLFMFETQKVMFYKKDYKEGSFKLSKPQKKDIEIIKNLLPLYINAFATKNLNLALETKKNLEFIFTSFFESDNDVKVYLFSLTETSSTFLIKKHNTQLLLNTTVELLNNIPSVWLGIYRVKEPFDL